MDVIIGLGITAFVYDARRHPDPKYARDSCLTKLVEDLAELEAHRLVLERDDAALRSDNALLYTQVRKAGLDDSLRYEHMPAYEECLLALPDAVAWCWAKGGQWRARAGALVSKVENV